jgi:hypothetical protein
MGRQGDKVTRRMKKVFFAVSFEFKNSSTHNS